MHSPTTGTPFTSLTILEDTPTPSTEGVTANGIWITTVAEEGIFVLGGWASKQLRPRSGPSAHSANFFYATLCRVLRKRCRGTLDNVQHALVTSLKVRGRDTIPV